MSAIRYHFDEHMDNAIVVGLRLREIDVTTTVASGLLNASDLEQLTFAANAGRVFVTCDRRIAASINGTHSGIVITKGGRKRIGPNVHALAHLHRTRSAEAMVDQVVYLKND